MYPTLYENPNLKSMIQSRIQTLYQNSKFRTQSKNSNQINSFTFLGKCIGQEGTGDPADPMGLCQPHLAPSV